jgi:hypothetical protein
VSEDGARQLLLEMQRQLLRNYRQQTHQINTLRYEPLLAIGLELSQFLHPLPRFYQKPSGLTLGQPMKLTLGYLYLNSPINLKGIYKF